MPSFIMALPLSPYAVPIHLEILLLLSTVRGSRPGKQVQLGESEIRFLCLKAREIFMSQPILLELEAPIKICGKPLSTSRHVPIFHGTKIPLVIRFYHR